MLRAGGRFIVSTPDRAVYSARGEHFNEFHLLELTEAEFEAFLRTHFTNVALLHQRAFLGSVIAAAEAAGPWRSYERRVPEYIEASSSLARAPYLIGVASDAELPHVASSAYVDRRDAQEAAQGAQRALAAEARAAERERERDAARATLTEAEGRAAERERERDAARATLMETEARAAELERERDAARATLTETEARAAERERERDAARATLTREKSRVNANMQEVLAAARERNSQLIRRIEKLDDSLSALESERDVLLQDMRRTSEDRLCQLAGLQRVGYDGRVPKRLGGLGLLVPRRARKQRQLARIYRILAASPLFDGQWYLSANPDVAEAKIDPVLHYLLYGAREGRSPGPKFNGAEYQGANPDVTSSGMNPLVHYVLYGRMETRRTSTPWELISEVRTPPAPLQELPPPGPAPYKPLVSVIVPNYNHKDYLAERIDSILHQTYNNIEIILLDDKSTDGSQELLRDYHNRYVGRVRLLLNDANPGNVFSQWRKGLDLVGGELIWICESDDYCERDFLGNCSPPADFA